MSPPPGSGNQTKPSAVEWLKVGSIPPAMVAIHEVYTIVLGVPLCMWQTNLCTIESDSAGQTFSPVKSTYA